MPEYQVSVVCSFLVKIQANSAAEAARLSEFFLTFSDGSSAEDKEKYQFEIKEIELTQNDSLEAVLLETDLFHK